MALEDERPSGAAVGLPHPFLAIGVEARGLVDEDEMAGVLEPRDNEYEWERNPA